MKLKHLIGVAAATFGLALAAQAAPAGPTPGGAALAWTHNGVTLAGGHTGPHTYSGSGGYTGPHIYGGSGGYSGKHIYTGSGSYSGKHIYSGSGGYTGKHIYSGNGRYRTYGAYGRHDGWRHHRGYWRGRGWGTDYGYGTDESCFAECLTSGYSPAYCTANSWQFCW